jgi:hypothetical protein
MEMPIEIIVTNENASEVLARRQSGENICIKCVLQAFEVIKSKAFIVPQNQE